MNGTADLDIGELLIPIKPKILLHVEQMKIASAKYALCMAQSPAQKKKTAQTKSSLERYGSLCFY